MTPFAFLYLNIKHRNLLKKQELSQIPQWDCLYTEFSTDKSWLKACFYTIFIVRRLIYALTLVFLHSLPYVQAALTVGHSALVRTRQNLGYVLVWQPNKSRLELYSSLSSELAITAVFSLTLSCSLLPSLLQSLETAAVVCTEIAIAVPTLLGLLAAAGQLRAVWRQYVQKRYEVSRQTY